MKPIPDCIPEALALVLETARVVSDDAFIHRKVLRKVMTELVKETDFGQSPADIHLRCLSAAYKALGVKDPYENEKARRNKAFLGLEKGFREYLDVAPDRLAACVNLAMAGHISNMGALGRAEMEREILEHLDIPVERDERETFMKAIARAESIMYITNTAGELALDKLLIEELAKTRRIIAVVQSKPMLLAATHEDAEAVGLPDVCEVIDPGAPMLGLMLERASSSFRETFKAVDVVLAKGETNFQTLFAADREIFFLFQARCATIAEHLKIAPGGSVFLRHAGRPGTGVFEMAGAHEPRAEEKQS